MTSTAPATPAVAPMDVAPATPAAVAAPTATDAQSIAPPVAAATPTNTTAQPQSDAPISADALNSALNKPAGDASAASTGDVSDVPNFVAKLLQNNEIPSDEKLLQMGEKMLEQTQMSMQVQQEMQELRQRLARFESEQDTKSRQQVEQQVQLLEQALATDPNNPAFASNGITKDALEQYKQTLTKLVPEERDLMLRVNQSVAAFGMNAHVTETFESQPSAVQHNHHDELARLRQQEQESRERAALLERQQRQQSLVMRFANIPAMVSSRAPTPMPAATPMMSGGSAGSCAMAQMFQSGASRPAFQSAGVANFGTSPSVSQRMSEDTFSAAAAGTAKRTVDSSNDAMENPAKKTSGSTGLVMGRMSNDLAALSQKARLFKEKQDAQKKAKKY